MYTNYTINLFSRPHTAKNHVVTYSGMFDAVFGSDLIIDRNYTRFGAGGETIEFRFDAPTADVESPFNSDHFTKANTIKITWNEATTPYRQFYDIIDKYVDGRFAYVVGKRNVLMTAWDLIQDLEVTVVRASNMKDDTLDDNSYISTSNQIINVAKVDNNVLAQGDIPSGLVEYNNYVLEVAGGVLPPTE